MGKLWMAAAGGLKGGTKAGNKRGAPEEGELTGGKMRKTEPEGTEFKVMFKLKEPKGTGGFRAVNPLKIAESLKGVGEVEAKILANGMLLVMCKSAETKKKANAVKKIAGLIVEVYISNRIEGVKGVIYGVCADITEKEMKEQIKGGEVKEVKRFKARNGGNPDAPVLITFDGDSLPLRVFFGCLSFQVKKYERPPLRCFQCQRFGHVAAACRGSKRCTKCGGEHDLLECEVTESKCCNCGGSHMASFRGCHHAEKAKQVQEVKEQHKISYAEALKKIDGRSDRGSVYVSSQMASVAPRSPPPRPQVPADSIVVKKESLLAFMVDVMCAATINSAKVQNKSDVMKVVAEAAERFLGMGACDPVELHAYMARIKGKAPKPQEKEVEEIEIDQWKSDDD